MIRHWLIVCVSLIILAVGLGACSNDRVVEPTTTIDTSGLASAWVDPELAAAEFANAVGWEFDPEVELSAAVLGLDKHGRHYLHNFDREELPGDVAHYSFTMQVGPGEHDIVCLHRVVAERRPYRPIRTRKSVFLQHGDAVGFVKFLFGAAAPSAPDEHAAAIFLAQNDVDVWGIDSNWALVPGDTSEFGFMADWGLDNQIQNLRTGLAVARFTRLITGGGFGKMHLLGYSSGAALAYAYANDEAVRPCWQQHVKGLIPVDMIYKISPEDEAGRMLRCAQGEMYMERLAAGEYADMIVFQTIGILAMTDPEGASPIVPGVTNYTAFLIAGAATFSFIPFNDFMHYFGGEFDMDTGLPTGLVYTPEEYALDFLMTGSSYEALQFMADYNSILCGEDDVPWDDNLAEISIPVLYIGAAGGLGHSGLYTLDQLGSSDVTVVMAELMPEEYRILDYGHIDLWTAPDAPEIVWQPLLDWILSHGHCEGSERQMMNDMTH